MSTDAIKTKSEISKEVPSKDVCEDAHKRIHTLLMKNFEENLKSHHSQGHKWFVQGTVHSCARELELDKQVVIFVMLGANARFPAWGKLNEVYGITPIKYILRKEVVERGRKVLGNTIFKVFFGDLKGSGDFNMKVDFFPRRKKAMEEKDDDGDSVASADTTELPEFKKAVEESKKSKPVKTWARVVAKPKRETTNAGAGVAAVSDSDKIASLEAKIDALVNALSKMSSK